MMNTGIISSAQNNWPLSNQRSISDDMKPFASTETEKSTDGKDTVNSAAENYDRYIKSDEHSERTTGIYRLEKDENGNPKIAFDRPEGEKYYGV